MIAYGCGTRIEGNKLPLEQRDEAVEGFGTAGGVR